MANFPYQRLPGKQWSPIGYSTLWLGEDHLLSVQNHRVVERYNRYYYRDIQAIVLQREEQNWAPAIVAILTLSGALAIVAAGSIGWKIFGGICLLGIVPLLIFAIRYGLGSCRCALQTAIGVAPLPSLNRLPAAQQALDRIVERIRLAQGEVDLTQPVVLPERVATAARLPSLKEPFEDRYRLFLVGAMTSALTAGIAIWRVRQPGSAALEAAWLATLFLTFALSLAGTVLYRRMDMGTLLRIGSVAQMGAAGLGLSWYASLKAAIVQLSARNSPIDQQVLKIYEPLLTPNYLPAFFFLPIGILVLTGLVAAGRRAARTRATTQQMVPPVLPGTLGT